MTTWRVMLGGKGLMVVKVVRFDMVVTFTEHISSGTK
jgi:hypothetical protein